MLWLCVCVCSLQNGTASLKKKVKNNGHNNSRKKNDVSGKSSFQFFKGKGKIAIDVFFFLNNVCVLVFLVPSPPSFIDRQDTMSVRC